MSTVAQVESAIERLSTQEQRHLLEWLLARTSSAAPPASRNGRVDWLKRLAQLRARLATGQPGPSTEQLLAEDRGD